MKALALADANPPNEEAKEPPIQEFMRINNI